MFIDQLKKDYAITLKSVTQSTRADEALFKVKQSGRNRAILADV
jgi:PleD family two-component response regulator